MASVTRSGRISKRPERLDLKEPVEDDFSDEDEDEDEDYTDEEDLCETEDEDEDGDENGNLRGFVVDDEEDEDA